MHTRVISLISAVSAVVLLASSAAMAQTTVIVETAPAPRTCRHGWCGHRPWDRPNFVWGLDGGVGAFTENGPFSFNDGIGAGTSFGPSWGARLGVEFLPWLAIEGRYMGMYNQGNTLVSHGGTAGLLTNAGAGVLRLTLPVPFVRPYIFGGVGIYRTTVVGSASSRDQSSLTDSTEPGIPFGVGLDIPVSWHMSVGVEATYHRLINESFSTNPAFEGGDLFTLNGVMRFRH